MHACPPSEAKSTPMVKKARATALLSQRQRRARRRLLIGQLRQHRELLPNVRTMPQPPGTCELSRAARTSEPCLATEKRSTARFRRGPPLVARAPSRRPAPPQRARDSAVEIADHRHRRPVRLRPRRPRRRPAAPPRKAANSRHRVHSFPPHVHDRPRQFPVTI